MPNVTIAPRVKNTSLVFDMEKLRDFRSHIDEILKSGLVEHTPTTLKIIREASDPNNTLLNEKFDFIERKMSDSTAGRPRLHTEVLAAVIAVARILKVKSILDVGCGEGLLITALSQDPFINKIIGIDIDPHEINQARSLLNAVGPENSRDKVEARELDVTKIAGNHEFHDLDAIILSEVVEHISEKDWIKHVLALNAKAVIVTTPNVEFNPLYKQHQLEANGLRHPDHRFEFSRQEFIEWGNTVGRAHDYLVDFLPIGPASVVHGSATQMAVFQRIN